MTETFLDFMLGPFRLIATFYFENQVILNTIIVGIALYKILSNKKKNRDKDRPANSK